jgi:hypothetical protein
MARKPANGLRRREVQLSLLEKAFNSDVLMGLDSLFFLRNKGGVWIGVIYGWRFELGWVGEFITFFGVYSTYIYGASLVVCHGWLG